VKLYWVWRRELRVMLRAPVVYVVGGLFLVVQGIAFAGLVGALSDPRRPAPLGALLEGQLAGTLLTWVLQLVVITLLGMRAIADERRDGAWELLLTTGVGERAAVVGKWLAASTVYALLWVPTLLYLGVVAVFRADSGGWDLATIACGYAGAIALGAALLAWSIAASAATTSTLAAGALGFALTIGVFLIGELPAAWPDVALDHPALATALGAISLRGRLGELARGEITAGALALIAGLAATGLSVGVALACAGRRRSREVRARFAATGLLALIAALLVALALRHPVRWDVGGQSSLDPQTRAVIAELPATATITIIEPTLGALSPLYDEVARVVQRMTELGPVRERRLDPAHLPGGIDAAAREAGLLKNDLQNNGGVVVELGGKRRVVDVVQLADIELGVGGAPAIRRLAIEQAIAGALAELASPVPLTACAVKGHGELPIRAKAAADADWTIVADRLGGIGIGVDDIELAAGVPPRCQVVLVAGPTSALTPNEALALQAFVSRGGGLLVAAASRPTARGELAPTGLDGLLASEGLGLPAAIAIDPTLAMRELPGALIVFDGYADHPVNVGFARVRPTLWYQPRVVITADGAKPLISATAASWGERDLLHGPPARDPDDLVGPVALAALGGHHRVIALGSAESFASSLLAGGASAGDLWIAQAVRFLAGRPVSRLAIESRTPAEVRLIMTDGERRAVIALCTGGIPLAWVLVGGGLVMWRRRRTR
jgi:ABC-2 type transport system permease protein